MPRFPLQIEEIIHGALKKWQQQKKKSINLVWENTILNCKQNCSVIPFKMYNNNINLSVAMLLLKPH